MNWFKKIRAGALQFVLFVGAIIAVLLLCFGLLAYTHDFFGRQTALMTDLIQATNNGLTASLKRQIPLGASVDIPTELNTGVFTTVVREPWGIFDIYEAKSVFKKQQFEKIALVGGGREDLTYGLYLTEHQRPLIVAGSARIEGAALLPERGIRPGNIAGHAYYRSQLLYGPQRQSTEKLPALNFELKARLKLLTDLSFRFSGEEVRYQPKLQLANSFSKPSLIVRGSEVILETAQLVGNIIIQAERKIVVERSAVLQDVILLAPEIVVKEGFIGNFQAFASKRISLQRNAMLSYPSALIVNQDSTPKEEIRPESPKILIAPGAEVRGLVAYFGAATEHFHHPQIHIETSALVKGEVYCEKNLELEGKVQGTVYTDGFMALENGNIYQNHLFNGIINGTGLPPVYAGLSFEGISPKRIGKWLY